MQVLGVGFGNAKFDNRDPINSQNNILQTWQPSSENSCNHTKCNCYFVPPHVKKKINKASTEQLKEQGELIADSNEAAHRAFRENRSLFVKQPHEPEHHDIFGFHTKTTQEKGESLQLLYDANGKTHLPGKVIKKAKDSNDMDTHQAYIGGVATYVFFKEILNRDSINNKGMAIKSNVNYDEDFNNAFWNGTQMVYGKGDGIMLHNLTHIDVVAHELGHGVMQYTANFDYQDQSGALNEHASDVWGSCVKQYTQQQTVEQADWCIGDGVVVQEGQCLRRMDNPGTAYDNNVMDKDPQPASFDAYDYTREDDGGVHINSGIPNRAFYLVSKALGGNVWDKAAQIWFSTISNFDVAKNKNFKGIPPLSQTTNFEQFATRTVLIAGTLYGKDSPEQKAVIYAWKDVKVNATV